MSAIWLGTDAAAALAAQKAPVDREFCSRSQRTLEWALSPQVTTLAQVPPPYDLGPDMNIHGCNAP